MSIERVLREQGGVISRHQATAAGLSSGTVDDQVRRRRWRPLYPRVYLASVGPAGPEVWVRAALLWVGADAVLTGAAAAWWFGLLEQPPATVTVAVPRQPPPPRGGVLAQRRGLAAVDLVEHRGLRLTVRPLTVLEAAVELGGAGSPLLDRALRGGLPWPEVHEAYRRHPTTRARLLLDAAAVRADAEARQLLTRLLRDSGTPGWRLAGSGARPLAWGRLESGAGTAGWGRPGSGGGPGGQLVEPRTDRRGRAEVRGGAPATVVFPAARVAVGVSGWAQPLDGRGCRVGPRPRPAATGWTVLHVPWADLVARPAAVLADISAAVAGAPASLRQ